MELTSNIHAGVINPSNGYALSGTITPETPLPEITNSYNIDGSGSSTLFVNANLAPAPPVFRVFKIGAGVEDCINNLTIEGGRVTGDNGGGIFNAGTLTLLDDVIAFNQANASLGGSSNGGGIYNAAGATLTLVNSEVEENSASGYGGGIDNLGTFSSEDSQIVNANYAKYGGGTANQGLGAITKLLQNTGVGGNVASSSGGGIYNSGGTVSVKGSGSSRPVSISSNSAGTGGGIYVSSGKLTLSNAGFPARNLVDSNSATKGAGGGGMFIKAGTVNVSGTSFTHNSATNGEGGGIYNFAGTLTISGGIGPGNSAMNGGGMYLGAKSVTTFGSVTVNGNKLVGNPPTGKGTGVAYEKGAIMNPQPPGPPNLNDFDDPKGPVQV